MKKILFVFATVAALLLASCSNASGGSGNAETQNGGTPAGGGQGGTQGPEGGQPEAPIDPALKVPLTLEAIEAGAVVTFCNKAEGAVTYKVNDGEAQTIAKDETKAITLANAGDKVTFYGDNKVYASHPWPSDDWSFESYTRSSIDCSADCYVYGNIMSLIKSENFAKADFEKDISQAFFGLFAKNTHIKNKDGSDLLLPAATASNGCYKYMFMDCTGLTKAPALPATKVEDSCYNSMFKGCVNLESAPALLPATKLDKYCYGSMFEGCSKLESAPALPATVLEINCYSDMFNGCSSLKSAPALPATTLTNYCYHKMFKDCINLTEAPELPAETLSERSYFEMFHGCSKLEKITCLATDISAEGCVTDWTYKVAKAGTFTKAAQMHDWPTSENGIPSGWEVKGAQEPTGTPLTLEAVSSAATVTFVNKADGPVWYKVNGGEKQTIASGETKEIALAAAGDKVAFYGNNSAYAKDDESSNIACSAPCYIYGNVMSLVSSHDFDNAKTLYKSQTFRGLFKNNDKIQNKAGETLLLPATTLKRNCYFEMFYGCSSLTIAPEIPATTVAGYCCYQMFFGCTSLTTAPATLPAKTLAERCYHGMFVDCSSLTATPALPATTVAEGCYSAMFSGCSSLTTAPATLPAETLAGYCYYTMFSRCSSLTTAPALPATTLADGCYGSMFDGCVSLSTAPDLPATTLADGCYGGMFKSCVSLSTAPDLPATTLAGGCYYSMFSGCTSLTTVPTTLPAITLEEKCYYGMFLECSSLATAPVLPATTLVKECYRFMFVRCSNLSSITCLATDISAESCVQSFYESVKSTGTFTKAASMTATLAIIPPGWAVVDYQP